MALDGETYLEEIVELIKVVNISSLKKILKAVYEKIVKNNN